jgi:hypothetical protein
VTQTKQPPINPERFNLSLPDRGQPPRFTLNPELGVFGGLALRADQLAIEAEFTFAEGVAVGVPMSIE